MAAACGGEVEDLITCPICLCEYDEVIENRKPKFLSCSHTVCLECLKGLQNSFLVSCPLCRKILSPSGTLNIASVPTNTYALCILKMTKADRKPAEPVKKMTKPNWCLTCGSIGKMDCPILHSTLDMTAHTMSNFEALLAVKEHYSKVKEPIRSKLESAIKKEKELQNYLDKILQAIQSLQIEITTLDGESKLRLAGMVSQLDSRLFSTGSKEEENDAFLSELFSLVNSSQPEETLETLKKKMEDSFKEIETNLKSFESVSELPDSVNSTKIAVQLFSEQSAPLPCPDLLKNGFISKWKASTITSNSQRELLLLSHLIFTVWKRHSSKDLPAATSTSPSASATKSIPPVPIIKTPMIERFVQHESRFIFKLKHLGIPLSRVVIRPTLNHPNFVQKLGDFCFNSTKMLTLPVRKAVDYVFVIIPLSIAGFQPSQEATNVSVKADDRLATRPLEVGLMKIMGATPNEPACWGLIFMLERFCDPKYAMHLKGLPPAFLFGHVLEGSEALLDLSRAPIPKRLAYTFSLESK